LGLIGDTVAAEKLAAGLDRTFALDTMIGATGCLQSGRRWRYSTNAKRAVERCVLILASRAE
jgi:hypothetical protein